MATEHEVAHWTVFDTDDEGKPRDGWMFVPQNWQVEGKLASRPCNQGSVLRLMGSRAPASPVGSTRHVLIGVDVSGLTFFRQAMAFPRSTHYPLLLNKPTSTKDLKAIEAGQPRPSTGAIANAQRDYEYEEYDDDDGPEDLAHAMAASSRAEDASPSSGPRKHVTGVYTVLVRRLLYRR
ncbi:hypothetical protein FIBSPDRAFT_899249 [Athelia psychrophila]|uniref:Uncharacterized protein n=1 Tax=Athelia psychrophila TaxID=1759441 RepID=A0A166A116_9AGAM|nr:hypothetical protein FIBSPDRAFT_899249 [Fibularhizoctonia sp. CBS 109695]